MFKQKTPPSPVRIFVRKPGLVFDQLLRKYSIPNNAQNVNLRAAGC
jgi:hypothetical protein